MDNETYNDGDIVIVITKKDKESTMILSRFPQCLEYIECADQWYSINEWNDGCYDGTILTRASVEKVGHISNILDMVNKVYVHKVGHVSYDEDRDCDSHSSGIERNNIVDSFFYIIGEASHINDVLNGTPDEILAMVQRYISDSFDPEYGGTWAVMTEEAYVEEQSEKERKRLEQSASWFSHVCGHPVGSVEYVLAVQKAMAEREQDMMDDCYGERRMERAAAARFCGQSSEDYWSDEDYIRDQHEDHIFLLANVLQWLELNCPLLMLKVQEKELALA